MEFLEYNPKRIKVFGDFDLCVVGGSCTGVFAAVRAARLGLKVAVVEKSNCFGGVACQGLVNIWHSLYDTDFKNQIIAGLTQETVERLEKRNCVQIEKSESAAIRFDPNELKYVLDNLVTENKITVFFHTFYGGLSCEDKKIDYIIVNNKDGFGAIRAKFFVDATGDGDLMRDLEIESYQHSPLQPPSSCFFMQGDVKGSIDNLIKEHGAEFGLDDDWGWSGTIPGIKNITFRADNHIFDVDCKKADDLTKAEIEGRKKAYAFVDLLRKYDNPDCRIVSLCSHIGIRETIHYKTNFQASELDLLTGKRYENSILNGTYRVDIHHGEDNGITFKYLDGRQESFYGKAGASRRSNWREELGLKGEAAKYYQVPFDILVQEECDNVIAAGRMINADEGSFGALRVMVNLNQLGEAAGVGAYISINEGKKISKINSAKVRELLKKGGSV